MCFSPALRVTEILFSVSSGGWGNKAMLPIFPSFFLSQHNRAVSTKGGGKRLGISRDFVNSPVGVREVAAYAADLRCPETAATL